MVILYNHKKKATGEKSHLLYWCSYFFNSPENDGFYGTILSIFFFFLTLEFRKLSDATTSLAYWFFSPCILMRFVHSTWTLTAYTRGRCTDDREKNIYRLTDHQLLCSVHQGVCLLLAGKFFGALRSKSESHCKKLFTYILPNSSIFTLHVELLTKTYFTV